MSNLLAAIRARDSKVSGVRIEMIGRLADSPSRFDSIDLLVSAEGPDLDQLPHLIEIADKGCIMMNTLRGKLPIQIRAARVADFTNPLR